MMNKLSATLLATEEQNPYPEYKEIYWKGKVYYIELKEVCMPRKMKSLRRSGQETGLPPVDLLSAVYFMPGTGERNE